MTHTIVGGLDVGKDSASFAWWRSDQPINNPKDTFDYEVEILTLSPDKESLQEIVSKKPPGGKLIVFLEPTGSYSLCWIESLRLEGVEVHRVSHNLVNSSRLALCNWSDKDDEHDAFVLLMLGLKWLSNPGAVTLVREKDPIIQQLSELYLSSESCNKVLNGLINRARQKLHREAPNLDDVTSPPGKNGISPFWGWIAGLPVSLGKIAGYKKKLAKSIGSAAPDRANKFSLQLVAYAKSICDWQQRRRRLDDQMQMLMKDPRFSKYIKIFVQFGASLDTQVALLIQLYPFEQFLGDDGQPIIKIKRRGTKSGKPTKAHVSCRKFHSALGMAPNQRSSGNKVGQIISGSGACRIALWRLVRTRIEPNTPASLRNRFGKLLRERLNNDKYKRDHLMESLLKVLESGGTLQAVKAALLDSDDPMAVTVASDLEQRVTSSKPKVITDGVACSLSRLAISRCCARLVKLLFKEFVKVFCRGQEPVPQDDVSSRDGIPLYLSGKALASRLGKSPTWLWKMRDRLKTKADFQYQISRLDPQGVGWQWHERKFFYSIPPGEPDDQGKAALAAYD